MEPDRSALRKPAAVERRSVVAPAIQRSAAGTTSLSAAQALQQRLGNQGTQALLSRAVTASASATVNASATAQCARVSQPSDPAELEAKETARKVVKMDEPQRAEVKPEETTKKPVVQRAAIATSASSTPAVAPSPIGGTPLPPSVRSFMEPRFGANFSNVRVHTGEAAAQQSASLQAQAFTVGEHVFFGRGQYQPESTSGRELIAHELTHTIQQGASPVVHRSSGVTVAEQVEPHVQRSWFGIPNPREYFAGKAANIPGFTMLTVVIGYNPITNARVERSAGNILMGAIQLIPGGKLITDALNNHGVFNKVSQWASTQFETLKDIGSSIWQGIENFVTRFKLTDLADPGGVWDQAKAIVERPIDRVKAFAIALKNGIVVLIKEAILQPIAAFARTTSGYPLLCTVMGKDPITGETVPQDAENLLGAFMKFIGEEEIWTNMQKAKAIPRTFAWFKGALGELRAFVNQIPELFVQAFRSLEISDIILIPRAFLKLAGVFGNFAARFISWGVGKVWNLLEIIFDVVSPGALAYIKKTGAALKSILKNPLPFVGNLVKAAKQGFLNFADRFLDHLKAGLIDWLTGSLPGIYIPKAFSLPEIAKFVFSVLGLSWANIRLKLVKVVGEPAVKAMETGFDIVVTLVRDGPAAAWDKIKEQLTNLKDMVIGGITDFVVDMVVKKAIPKLVSMFIPGAGFISAILSIYDTVMVFVNKIKQIVQVVTGFIDSIVAIASGAIGAAATRVETTLAGVLSLAINFLAGFAGLGKVADKVMGVINKVRAPIDKALDWLVGWIVTMAKKLFTKVFGKKAQDGLNRPPIKMSLGFEMHGKSHTLFTEIRNGRVSIEMASSQRAALLTLTLYAIKQTKNKTAVKRLEKLYEKLQAETVLISDRAKDAAAIAEANKMNQNAANTLRSIGNDYGISNLQDIPHKSEYVDSVMGVGYRIKQRYEKVIRSFFYPKDYDEDIYEKKRNYIKNNKVKGKDGFFMGSDKNEAPIKEATIDHKPRVVQHWLDKGRLISHEDRGKWYRRAGDESEIRVIGRRFNSSDGAEAKKLGLTYLPDNIGKDFTGPNE